MSGDKTKILIVFIISVLLLSSIPVITSGSGEKDGYYNDVPSRSSAIMEETGGEFHENFQDDYGVDSLENTTVENGEIVAVYDYHEDFTDYYTDQNLVGVNGWIEHDTFTDGEFTAVNDHPPSSEAPLKSGKVQSQTYSSSYAVLSEEYNISKGSLSFWIFPSGIPSADHMLFEMSLIGNSTTNATDDDKITSMRFRYHGLAYKTDSWKYIASNLAKNWYKIVIEFDCGEKDLDFSLYSYYGSLIATKDNVEFQNDHDSLKRVMFRAGKYYSYQYPYAYINDLKIVESDHNYNTTMKKFDLSDGMSWDRLLIAKRGTPPATVEILNGTGGIIPGFTYDQDRSNFDLSHLNDLGVRSIVLRFTVGFNMLESSNIREYTITWNSTKAFRDPFLGPEKTFYLLGTGIWNGKLQMYPDQYNGVFLSRNIDIPNNCYWDRIIVDSNIGDKQNVLVDIIDPTNNRSIPGYSDLSPEEININNLDSEKYHRIKIRLRMSSGTTNKPSVETLAVTWLPNNNPTIDSFEFTRSLKRSEECKLWIKVSDPEQHPSDLSVSVDYKVPGDDTWSVSNIEPIVYNGSSRRWETVIEYPIDCAVGNYTYRIFVYDELEGMAREIIINATEVKNNVPTAPLFRLSPEFPYTTESVNVELLKESNDVETEYLLYTYIFMINGEEVENARLDNVTDNDGMALHYTYTEKHDEISVMIFTNDGLNCSEVCVLETRVMNSKPEINEDLHPFVFIEEDSSDNSQFNLAEATEDDDDDELIFTSNENDNITVEIGDDGSVDFVPNGDFFGEENITFLIKDGDEVVELNITVVVSPINDPPNGSVVYPSADRRVPIGEYVTLQCEVFDVDTPSENLTVQWKSNNSLVAAGNETRYAWDTAGIYNLDCIISDGEFEVTLESFTIEVFKPDPPYTRDQIDRYYNNSGKAIVYDITDIYGNGENPREGEVAEINITQLTAEWNGDDIVITMELQAPALNSTSLDEGYGDGSWATYNVFIVNDDWSENEFAQDEYNLYGFWDQYDPLHSSYQGENMEIPSYLTYGYVHDIGSPERSGNTITWKISMYDLGDTDFDVENFNLFAVSQYIRSTDGQMTSAYDTAGNGADQHTIVLPPVEKDDGDDGPPVGLIIGIIIIVIVIILAVAGVAIFLIMRRKGSEDDEKEDKEAEGEEQEGPKMPGAPPRILSLPMMNPAMQKMITAPPHQGNNLPPHPGIPANQPAPQAGNPTQVPTQQVVNQGAPSTTTPPQPVQQINSGQTAAAAPNASTPQG